MGCGSLGSGNHGLHGSLLACQAVIEVLGTLAAAGMRAGSTSVAHGTPLTGMFGAYAQARGTPGAFVGTVAARSPFVIKAGSADMEKGSGEYPASAQAYA